MKKVVYSVTRYRRDDRAFCPDKISGLGYITDSLCGSTTSFAHKGNITLYMLSNLWYNIIKSKVITKKDFLRRICFGLFKTRKL